MKRECGTILRFAALVLLVALVVQFTALCGEMLPKAADGSTLPARSGDATFTGIPYDQLVPEMQAAAAKKENILFRTAIFDPLAQGEPSFQGFDFPKQEPREWDYFLMQFHEIPSDGLMNDLYKEGVYFYKYIPNNTYIVSLETALLERIVMDHKEIRWAGFFKGGYKVDPNLLTRDFSGKVFLDITVFPGEDPFSILSGMHEIEKSVSFSKLFSSEIDPKLRISVDGKSVRQLVEKASAIRGIEAIDFWVLPHLMNNYSIWVVQTYVSGSQTIWDHGITGTGQYVGVSDSGCDSDMCFFRNWNGTTAITDYQSVTLPNTGTLYPTRKVVAYYLQDGAEAYDESASSYHGTHVCGSILGDNLATPSTPTSGGHDSYDGMAPNAQLIFQDVGDSAGDLTGLSNDNYLIYQQAYNAGARIHSNSWGGDTQGVYTSDCKTVDTFIFDHEDFLLYFANGNAYSAGEVGSPASAKNCISIGALTHGSSSPASDSVASFTSRGPTADGRYKPDVSTPGSSILSALGTSSHTDQNCSYQSMDGTSMATPTAAGAGTLLRQYYYDGFYPTGAKVAANAMTPSAALMKASMINSCMDIGTPNIPNNDEGYGRVTLENVCYFSGDTRKTRVWDKRNVVGLSTGQTDEYQIEVASGQPLKVTLVWTDPQASTTAAITLVNNLNLQVISPSAQTYLGNVFSSGQSVTGGTADSLNNVETFLINAPTAGTWTIRVVGASIPGTPVQPYSTRQGYALVATFGECGGSPLAAPGSVTATNNGTTGIDLSWGSVSGASEYYLYRANGNCTLSAEKFSYMGKTTGTTFTDTLVQGGYTYAYKVKAADECVEGAFSTCATATYSGNCTLYPTFAGLTSATNNLTTAACDVDLVWSAGSSNCPLFNSVTYNVYRGTNPYFTVGPSSLLQDGTGLTATTYKDSNVVPNTTYYYIVRAEDATTVNGGPANGGNEEYNSIIRMATPYASTYAAGTWSDDGGDTNAKMFVSGEWTVTNTLNHTTGGTYSYHNAPDGYTHSPMQCHAITTPSLLLQSGQSPVLSYWVNYNLEYQFDGVVVEISTNGGSSWTTITPDGTGYPSDFSQTTSTPINACGYATTQDCFNGPSTNGALTGWNQYTHNLSTYAGSTVLIRWNFSSDPGSEFEGFYLDDIQVTFASVNNMCSVSNGIVSLDDSLFNCSDTVSINLVDSDLMGNGTQAVTIRSSTESSPAESVTLTETPASSGVFLGAISTTSAAPVYGNGVLSLANGDTITVTYIDANDGQGGTNVTKTDTATADCQGPAITNVLVSGITGSSATITWDTDQSANSRVTYGTSVPPGTNQDNLTSYVTSHTINLAGLTQCTTYYFSVTSADPVGNSTMDTNGGSYYTFTTGINVNPTYASTDVPVTIDGSATHTSTIEVTDDKEILDVNVTIDSLTHVYVGDVEMRLISPDATTVLLVDNRGSSGDNFIDTVFDDEASGSITAGSPPFTGSFRPEGTLSSFDSENALGTWTLQIIDTYPSLDDGTLNAWSINFTYPAQSCGPSLEYQSNSFTEACNGTGSGGGNTYIDPGEDVTLQLTLHNNGTSGVTNIVGTLSSSTTGVTVTDATASFPNIAADGTGGSISNHFAFHVDSTVACGTVLDFTIHMASNEGSWDDSFSLTVGNVVPGGTITDFSQNFTGGSPPALPTGWTESHTSGNAWLTSASYYCGAANGLYYPYNSSQAANSYVYTPGIALTAGVTYTLNFNQKIQSATWPENFEVKCGTAATPAGQTITILASAQYTNTTCTLRSPTFTVPTTGTYYISWHCTSAADMYYLIIDDISLTHTSSPSCTVETCTSSCSNPTQPTIGSVTDLDACAQSGVRVTFTAGSPSTSNALVVDGAEMATGIASPYDYNPGDTASHNYIVRTYNTASCHTDSTVTARADANNTPAPTISGANSNTCPATTVVLTTENGMSSYQWYVGGSPIGGANAYQYTVSASGTYTVSYTNGSGCSGTSAGHAVTISSCAVVPGEVASGGNFTWSGQTMNWTADANATGYRVYRGLLSNLSALCDATNDFCLRNDGAGTSFDVTGDDPSGVSGRCYYFLITGYSGAGEGPAGTATCGARQVNSPGGCS